MRLSEYLIAFLFGCFCFLPLKAVAQEIDFSGVQFHEPVDLEYWKLHPQDGIEVIRDVFDISRVMFRYPISFLGGQFYSTANFMNAKFDYTAYFSSAQFDSTAVFFGAKFHSIANFRWTRFDSTADFRSAQFHDKANFEGARFGFRALFVYAQFDSTADFNNARFDSTVNFIHAQFHSQTIFRWARFGDWVGFKYAALPDNLDFRDVIDIAKEIDFTSARPPGENNKCRIALAGTDIDKIKINMSLFELWFPVDTTFKDSPAGNVTMQVIDQIYHSSFDEKTSIYESVLKKLKDDGLMDSYRILDIDYRKFKYRHEGGLNWYVANTFHRLWWNYGYAKELIFLWTLGFLFMFSVLNINFYRRLSENVYAIPFLGKWDYNSMRWPKSWIYYGLQVVTYTAIIFFGLKMDIAKFKQGVVRSHPLLFVYLMFIYVLGLVCMGFIVNIIFTR